MKRMRNFNKKHIITAAVLAAVILLFVIVHFVSLAREKKATKEGLAFLSGLSSQDVGEVEEEVRIKQGDLLQEEMEARYQELINGSIDVWSLFGDTMIVGDSRAYSFYEYEFLPQNRVIAHNGDTIYTIADAWDQLVAENPTYIILIYGINDVDSEIGGGGIGYAEELLQLIQDLQAKLPHTKIYVNSIFPTTDAAIAADPFYANLPEYNDAVKEMCAAHNIGFIDCSDLISEHPDMYDVDGIHMVSEFYPLWGAQIWTQIYGDEKGE